MNQPGSPCPSSWCDGWFFPRKGRIGILPHDEKGGIGILPHVVVLFLVLAVLASTARGQEAAKLDLADLPAYRAALSGRAATSEPPRAVSFRDLWDHPEDWQGRRVTVRGIVARTFRQGAVGSFPPLVETWIRTRTGDLFCLVFPQNETDAKSGSTGTERIVAFTGTFLRTIRYTGEKEDRLAPLIVGDKPPAPTSPREAEAGGQDLAASNQSRSPAYNSWTPLTWSVGLLLGLAVAAVLAYRHLHPPGGIARSSSSSSSSSSPAGPPPEFLDRERESGPTAADR